MGKAVVDVTDAASDDPPQGSPPESLPWTSKTCLSAIDGAVVGNTFGFVLGAFPGMCVGAASGSVLGVLGGGLVAPVLIPAVEKASEAIPGKYVTSASGAAGSAISELYAGGGGAATDAQEQSTDSSRAVLSDAAFYDRPEGLASRADGALEPHANRKPSLRLSVLPERDLSATKDAFDAAMVRAGTSGAQGAVAGAEVGGTIVGMALAIPAAVVGSLVGGICGVYADIRDRCCRQQAATPAKDGSDSVAATQDIVAAPTKDIAAAPTPEHGRPTFKGFNPTANAAVSGSPQPV